jgi:Holliday junction resolvase RusA-like endonuclease
LVCAFTVYGDAKPQGSTKTITRRLPSGELRPVITHSNRAALRQWRQDIRAAAHGQAASLLAGLLAGPVAVRVWFWMTKPPGSRSAGCFHRRARSGQAAAALGDALEHMLFRSDAQIVHWEAWKVYTEGSAYAQVELWQPDAVLPVC